jgi:glucose/arabinose dehydrogenase
MLIAVFLMLPTCVGGGGNRGPVHLRLVRIASVEQPVALATRPRDATLYVAEKTGKVVAIRGNRADAQPVLDISAEVSGDFEQGLLGIVFSPDGRLLYVDFTDRRGDAHVQEFAMSAGRADIQTRRELLFVDQPGRQHYGGDLIFGPDHMLYIAVGDGGRTYPGKGGLPQRLDSVFGKILRVDPRPVGDRPYGIPADNPFVDRPGARPEIWVLGLRNPWRFSIDRGTGDLWIGEVGNKNWEEVDRQVGGSGGGENYGWSFVEGTHVFRGGAPNDALPPIFKYAHDGACAVIGGYVYQGSLRDLRGAYLFGDLCDGRVRLLRQRGGKLIEYKMLGLHVPNLSSFGEDEQGELYLLSLDGGVFRLGSD